MQAFHTAIIDFQLFTVIFTIVCKLGKLQNVNKNVSNNHLYHRRLPFIIGGGIFVTGAFYF